MSKARAQERKQAFDFARNSMWSVDPMDLCIVGGKVLPPDEQGPHDTEEDKNHPLWDVRLHDQLDEEFILNIYAVGVDTPILIAKMDGIAVVVAGRRRVRAARLANIKRKSRGEPLMKIDCKQKRADDAGLLGAMITENEGRLDDDLPSRIIKLKQLLNKGVSMDDAAIRFAKKKETLESWLAFDDNATKETKKAAEQGRISTSAAITLARIAEPDKQREALDTMLANAPVNGKASDRRAREAVRAAKGKAIVPVTDKRLLAILHRLVQEMAHPNAGEKTLAYWQGVEDTLALMNRVETDKRLRELLVAAYAEMKNPPKATKPKEKEEAA